MNESEKVKILESIMDFSPEYIFEIRKLLKKNITNELAENIAFKLKGKIKKGIYFLEWKLRLDKNA